jgi:signal transduction histidine kinase
MKVLPRLFTLLLCLALGAYAAETPAQKAEALVKRAAAYIKEKGKDAALKEFNNPKGKFVEGELYIFAYSLKNICLALPTKPQQVGQDLTNLADADGKLFFQDFHKAIESKAGAGWVDYKWVNPVTKKIQDKSSYLMNIPGQDMFIGCGFYK